MSDNESQQFYSKFSCIYGLWSKLFFYRYHKELAREVITRSNPQQILDVGSGPGDFLTYVRKFNPIVELFAQDISERMNDVLSQRIPEAQIKTGPADSLKYSDDKFGSVVNVLSFHHYSKPNVALKEMYRVLAPGGKLYLLDICPSRFRRPKFNIFGLGIGDGHQTYYTSIELKTMLQNVGFTIVEQRRLKGFSNFWLHIAEKRK